MRCCRKEFCHVPLPGIVSNLECPLFWEEVERLG
jgi:hypothetical protein